MKVKNRFSLLCGFVLFIHSFHLLFFVGLFNFYFSNNNNLLDLIFKLSSLVVLVFGAYFPSVILGCLLGIQLGKKNKIDSDELKYLAIKSAIFYFPFIFFPLTYTYPIFLIGNLNNMFFYSVIILAIGVLTYITSMD